MGRYLSEAVIASLTDDLVLVIILVVVIVLLIISKLPWYYLIPLGIASCLVVLMMYKGLIAQLRPSMRGLDEFKGLVGDVIDFSDGELIIRINGELWRARCVTSCNDVALGSKVEVVGRDGHVLLVKFIND